MHNRILLGLLSAGLLLVTPLNLLAAEQEAKLTAPDSATAFGYYVALSGDTALVWGGREGGGGCVYVYVRSGTNWCLQAQLVGEPGLGSPMALCGDTALVGSLSCAYVFVRSDTNWSQQAKLYYPSHPGWNSAHALALSGDTAVLTDDPDLWEDPNVGTWLCYGLADVYVRHGTNWAKQATLGLDTPFFGDSVAMAGDTILVGAGNDTGWWNSVPYEAPGSVHVFVRSGTNWSRQAILTASDGAVDDGFGVSLGIWGDTAIIQRAVTNSHVFVRSGGTWSQQAVLTLNEEYSHGYSTIWGDTALIRGATNWHVFARSGTNWTHEAILGANDGTTLGSASLCGDAALFGAAGSAYVFRSLPMRLAINSAVRSSSNLICSGWAGRACGTYYVLSSTDVDAPLANWARVATNTFCVDGTFSMTNTLDPSQPRRFFRLSTP